MKRRGSGMIAAGLALLAGALVLTGYNLREETAAQEASAQALTQLETALLLVQKAEEAPQNIPPEEDAAQEMEIPDYILDPQKEMPAQTVDGVEYVGLLSLPTLELTLPVIDQWSYAALKMAPCRYYGSAYTGDLVICGHNYAGHFRTLQKLNTEDRVSFTDMDGNVFSYEVVELEVLQPTDVEEMQTGDWELTLFTCSVGGQTRVAVRCKAAE